MTRQLEMFAEAPGPIKSWLPKLAALPLGADEAIALDTETTGLDVATGKSKAVGVSIYSPSRKLAFYLPFGHESGQQLERTHVVKYLLDQLPGKRVLLANARFDVHSLRTIGVDLEELGCEVHDVLHAAALLDEQRRSYSLDALSQGLLGQRKVVLPNDRLAIHEKPSHVVAPYAAQDARLTWDLGQVLKPKLMAERLDNVMELEDELVYATCEMERNGTRLNVDTLERWNTATARRYQDTVLELYRLVGFRVIPTSPIDLLKMFTYLGVKLDPREVTPGGKPQFTDDILKRFDDAPAVRLARGGRQLASLQSKYLEKYLTAADAQGVLRYQLNQLRSDEYGTVTGRYSSSNINIQQVFSVERQEGVTREFPVRNLFVPAEGKTWCLADASQIEFRIFAHYSEDERLISAYRDDPLTDFHAEVARLLGGVPRSIAKTFNFAMLYSAGRDRIAQMLRETLTPEQAGDALAKIKKM